MRPIIRYFVNRPLIINLLLFGVIVGAIGLWGKTGKEEYPDFTMPWIRFSIPYPGAAAEDVELFVTKPVEEKLKELNGLYEVDATSSYGLASFRITLEPDISNTEEVITDIKDAVDRTELPSDTEDPVFRRFNSAQKAIINIGLYDKGKRMLDIESRTELQRYALAFKNRMLALPEISGLDDQGYLKPELQIFVDPSKLKKFDISLDEIRSQITAQHVRMPAGSMEDRGESEVSFLSELDTPQTLESMIVRGGFEGQKIRLKEVASVRRGFERNKRILKIQGHEGVMFNVKKSATVDILTAQKAVVKFVDEFRQNYHDSPVNLVLIDDESYSIRNRLAIIGYNGLLGFLLILSILFIFLDLKSGIWVSAGIPFALGFTLISAMIMGYTINNVTLAGIIIVLGIVVDDAIIVAENISRLRRNGTSAADAAVEGTASVMQPVVASVLTTCAAFLPLYFFSGHFGNFIKAIPIIVFLMLGASLLESAFILPGHMYHSLPRMGIIQRLWKRKTGEKTGHWFFYFEKKYAAFLKRVLNYRKLIFAFFIVILIVFFYAFNRSMKFVMFPREETQEITILATAGEDTTRHETAKLTEQLEEMFLNDKNNVILSVLTFIGQSRRGGEVKENEAFLRVELLPPAEREIPLRKLLPEWESRAQKLKGFTEIRFMKSRWGSESGSPIELEVQENDDATRSKIALEIKAKLEKHPDIGNVEIEKPVTRREYRLSLRGDDVFLMGINPSSIGRSLRAFIEGQILYTLNKGDEEVDVRLTSEVKDKKDIDSILDLRAANAQGYLVPYRSLVTIEEAKVPASIQRINYRRTTMIYADLKENTDVTPLEIADYLEKDVFPLMMKGNPNTLFQFLGEIESSRESQADFGLAIILTISLIYFLLVLLYDSLILPLLIGMVIPFGVVGVIIAFMGHGMEQYGFFALVGSLGMIGVVINDSVVMIAKLESTPFVQSNREELIAHVADVSSTRLRAVIVTTLTTVAGLFPTAYGWLGFDSMLSEMMLAMGWGLVFGTIITLVLVPSIYSCYLEVRLRWRKKP